ncbi:hypothetical protein ACF0H5_014063 [Mactra antiquata]
MSLSPFQKEKLEYYFNFFDSDGNGELEIDDLDGFMKKVYEFTEWEEWSQNARDCYEIHECFFHTLTTKSSKEGKVRQHINLATWLSMWEKLLPGAMSMINFPVWLRLLPKSLFRIIDKKHDNVIDEKELADFYMKFVGIPKENVDSLATYAMEQMTDHGRWPLTMESYNQMFANFLIGKTPYGPGRFIFGCFEHMAERTEYQLIHGLEELKQTESELKNLDLLQHSPLNPSSIVKVKFFRPA